MNPLQLQSRRFSAWVQACGLLFMLGGMLLAQGAAALHFAAKVMTAPSAGIILFGALVYLLVAGLILAGLWWVHRHGGTGAFLPAVLGASILIQGAVILAADPEWTWTGDAHIFSQYLNQLSESGYSPETLGSLSRHYDYRVWARRAQPFYYFLRVGSGEAFVRSVQGFQALLVTLSLVLGWRIARLYFGKRVAFWSTCLQFLMPFRWFVCLDLNHHILGGFYFLAGLWLLAEWMRPNRQPWQTVLLFLCAGGLLPLMRLEGGIDTVFAAAVLLVLLLAGATGRQSGAQILGAAGTLLAWPLLVSTLLVSPLIHCIDLADRHRHESGPVAFMARGWAPETGGEYGYTYELIDYLTAPEDKKTVQSSILASQAFYNPRAILFPLLPVKIAKYFLLGYASGAEEMLVRNGARTTALLAKGARTFFLLVTLPLMIWGGLLILPLLRRPSRLPLILPCSIICGTYVLLGETSPRYSIYIQPFLFMLGALPLAWSLRRQARLLRHARAPGLTAAASLFAVLLLAAALLSAARPWLRSHAMLDMRNWTTLPPAPTRALLATLAPFEIHLPPETTAAGTKWGPLQLPVLPQSCRALSFYAIPVEAPSGHLQGAILITEYTAGDEVRTQTNSLPGRIRLEYSPSHRGVLTWKTPMELPFPLRIGYATCELHEKTTD